MPKLDDAQVAEGMKTLPGWARKGDTIVKTFTFKAFADGIKFVDRVAAAADKADHHPDIDIRYTKITMTLSTHSAGGLTRKDLELAGVIEADAAR